MRYPTISKAYPLILASSSPRRRKLLSQIGLPFRSVTSHVRERETRIGGKEKMCQLLAQEKAKDVHRRSKVGWVLGADTVVTVKDAILGKPSDAKEAKCMLSLLSGETHKVHTGYCILNPSGELAHSETVTTLVRMKPLSAEEIDAYIMTGEPFDKAGSYAIQGIGVFMIESISGSYTNVVGLPLCALVKALLSIGALTSFPLKRSAA
jgi:septum formation protein